MWPFKYPYSNFHEINLDWILKKIEELPGVIKTEVGRAINQISPETNPATKYLFFGDSYGATGNPWPSWVETVAQRLNLVSNEYWNLSANSTALSAGNWRGFLNNWLNNASEEAKKSIRYVILGGGINDSQESLVGNILPEMKLFVDIVKENLPNAEIYAGYFGYTTSVKIGDNRTPAYRAQAFAAWQESIKYGVHFIPGAVNCVHSIDLLYTDGIHPNTEGASNIANAMINGIHGNGYNQILKNGYETIGGDSYNIFITADAVTPYINQTVSIDTILNNVIPSNGRMCDLSYQLSTYATGIFETNGQNFYASLPIDLIYSPQTGAFNGVFRASPALNGQTRFTIKTCEFRFEVTIPTINC
jgi:lysophospholipase L1-like esterase